MQIEKPQPRKLALQNIGSTAELKYNDQGLIPTVVQDAENKDVLMVAYMNKESLQQTLDTGLATYWSRSRKSFWVKGETSGHFQQVREIYFDCDKDTLLILIKQHGAACHTGERSCFFTKMA